MDDVLALLKSMNDRLETRFQTLDDLASRMDSITNRVVGIESSIKERLLAQVDGKEEIPEKKWSWARYCYAIATKDWSIAPFEHEQVLKHQDFIQKTMLAGTYSAGGSLIPPQFVNELIEFVRPALIAQRLGVRILTGLVGSPIMIPKITSGATGQWVGEDTAPTAEQLATGQLQFRPHKCMALVKLSNDLAMLSNTSVEAAVRADITSALAQAIDTAVFNGTGQQSQPLGIANWTPALTSVSYTSTDVSTKLKSVMDCLKTLENQYHLSDMASWAMNPTSYWVLCSLADANKRPVVTPDTVNARASMLYGYPVNRSTLVSAAGTDVVYAGDWSQVVIGIWSTISVSGSTETSTAFEKDELWIRAIAHVDIGLRTEKAIVKMASVSS